MIVTKNSQITLKIKKKQGWNDNCILSMFAVTLHSCYTNVTVGKRYSCGSNLTCYKCYYLLLRY